MTRYGDADATRAEHPARRATVEGTVFEVSAADLAAADEYEVADYRRVAVPLRSGQQAWVYVFTLATD